MYNREKTSCSNCEHTRVCSFKETFANVQREIDAVAFCIDGGTRAVMKVNDIEWIDVTITCKHHKYNNTQFRQGDKNDKNRKR